MSQLKAPQPSTTGVILAGGLARRMHNQDKGLVHYNSQALISYAIHAMQPVVDELLINANRNQDEYAQFNFPIITDQELNFSGPLAGILSAMHVSKHEVLLVIPCDSPLIRSEDLLKLRNTLHTSKAEIAVAFDGERLQPVFLALRTNLKTSLAAYLASGKRKIDFWLQQHVLVQVDFSTRPDMFININTLTELSSLEQQYQPELSQAGLNISIPTQVVDATGASREIYLVAEHPLTIYVDKQEIVTLMTMGTHPEWLTLGYLKNQGFFTHLAEIKLVQVDWQTNAVAVITTQENSDFTAQLQHRTVTTGCGQGTVFGRLMDKLDNISLPAVTLKQSTIYAVLDLLATHNEAYKKSGAVHGCALTSTTQVDFFVEDVGRHNAVDAIAGAMWLQNISGTQKIFYTTGRLTSEMVIKVAQMEIPILISRSGATQMGLKMAQQAGVTLISRAKGKHFLVLTGIDKIVFDVNNA